MLLPNFLIVFLVSLPLLISSSPQKVGPFVCSNNSPCSPDHICNRGSCTPCGAYGCGEGAHCNSDYPGEAVCFCPGNTQGNPYDYGCRPVTECADDSHCRETEICSERRCIDNPCSGVECPTGSCKVVQGQARCQTKECADNSHCRQSEICSERRCIDNPCSRVECPTGSCKMVQGQAQCQKQAVDEYWCPNLPLSNCRKFQNRCPTRCHQNNVVGDRNQVINNQVNSQVGSAHGGSQGDGTQVNQQGSVNQGGGSGLNNGIQVSSGAQNSNINHVNAAQSGSGAHSGSSTQSGSRPQDGSGAQNNNQGGIAQGGCKTNSECGSNKRCQSGSCVDPCESVTCGKGAICQVSQLQGQCVCPENSQGNPLIQCHPKQGCTINSHCGSNERCQSRRCVDPCASVTCGEGAICLVSQRQGHCICPENSQGDPLVQCHSKLETPMNNETQSSPSSNITESNTGDTFFPDHVSTNEERTRDPGCITAPDPGECRGAFKRFYYNKQNDQCDCFLFGGCDEELIEFTWLTFEECQHICVPGKKTQGPGCKRATVEEVTAFLEEERRNRENKKN